MRIIALLSQKRSTILAFGIAMVMIAGVALPAYTDHVARGNIDTVVKFIESGRPAIESACAGSGLGGIRAASDLRLTSSEGSALVQDTMLQQLSSGKLEVTFALANFGPAWSPINQYKRHLVLEYSCTPKKQMAMRVAGKSTVEPLYLPYRIRP